MKSHLDKEAEELRERVVALDQLIVEADIKSRRFKLELDNIAKQRAKLDAKLAESNAVLDFRAKAQAHGWRVSGTQSQGEKDAEQWAVSLQDQVKHLRGYEETVLAQFLSAQSALEARRAERAALTEGTKVDFQRAPSGRP